MRNLPRWCGASVLRWFKTEAQQHGRTEARWRSERGQFIPIAAMITFSMVIFMIAVVNVYKVTRVKLRVQNLADAAALNLATQQAQAFNVVADRNEWMNHMIGGVPSPSDPDADQTLPGVSDCSIFDDAHKILIPGIACVENTGGTGNTQDLRHARDRVFKRHIFHSKEGARNYAALIQTINEAQFLFVQAYNSFLGDRTSGAASGSSTAGPSNFEGLLKHDIPDLDDPSIRMVAWNSSANESSALEQAQQADPGQRNTGQITSRMTGLHFQPHHDIETRYYQDRTGSGPFGIIRIADADIQRLTLGQLFYGNGTVNPGIGWMVPVNPPTISIDKNSGSQAGHIGVGVAVTEDLKLPVLGTIPIMAKAKAYIVQGSGQSGDEPQGASALQTNVLDQTGELMNAFKHRASVLQCFGASVNGSTAAQKHGNTFASGQATTELMLLMPLFVVLAGGALSIGYICWQGVKVQQAANLAARIHGQERISGGVTVASIRQQNGIDGSQDRVPDDDQIKGLKDNPDALSGLHGQPSGGVYGKVYKAVREMFGEKEQAKLFVPPPIRQGVNTDTVQVVRVLRPPKFGDLQLPPIKLEAYAYGGEDSHLYGLPRWGLVDKTDPFYSTQIKNPKND